MGIDAYIQLEDFSEPFLHGGKAIFAFCHDGLSSYCNRAELNKYERDGSLGQIRWFTALRQHMNTPLCLLNQAFASDWPYTEDEYEKYLESESIYRASIANHPIAKRLQPLFTENEFIERCQVAQEHWIDITTMIEVIEDILQALQNEQPDETWWYATQDTIPALEELSKVLQTARNNAHKKVRFLAG